MDPIEIVWIAAFVAAPCLLVKRVVDHAQGRSKHKRRMRGLTLGLVSVLLWAEAADILLSSDRGGAATPDDAIVVGLAFLAVGAVILGFAAFVASKRPDPGTE